MATATTAKPANEPARRLYAHVVVPPRLRKARGRTGLDNRGIRSTLYKYYTQKPAHVRAVLRKHGPVEDWDVSGVTDMSYLFAHENVANVPDLSRWDVSNVTHMNHMFYGVKGFNGDLSKWDVSNVTRMEHMFTNTDSFNGDLSKWDVSNVTDMWGNFYGAKRVVSDLIKCHVSPLPTRDVWMPPCCEFLLSDDDHSKNLRNAVASAAKYSDRARLVDPVKCDGDEHAEYRRMVQIHTRRICKTLVLFVKSLLYRAHQRLTMTAPTTHVNSPSTCLSYTQEDALQLIARWRLFMIWYGVGSPAEIAMRSYFYKWSTIMVKEVPLCMAHIVVAMCFNLTVSENRMGGGDAVIPIHLLMHPHSVHCFYHYVDEDTLLNCPLCVYGLVETSCDDFVYRLSLRGGLGLGDITNCNFPVTNADFQLHLGAMFDLKRVARPRWGRGPKERYPSNRAQWLWRLALEGVRPHVLARLAAYHLMELGARPDAEGNAPRGAIEAFCEDF